MPARFGTLGFVDAAPRRTLRVAAMRAALFLLVPALAGCFAKASYLPNPAGGWTLMTEAQNIDQAVVRFRRSAEDLCGPSYRLGEVEIMDRGWATRGRGTDLTVRVPLSCS
jgi:hypothetical protein